MPYVNSANSIEIFSLLFEAKLTSVAWLQSELRPPQTMRSTENDLKIPYFSHNSSVSVLVLLIFQPLTEPKHYICYRQSSVFFSSRVELPYREP